MLRLMHAFFEFYSFFEVRPDTRSDERQVGRRHVRGAATYHALCWKTFPSWSKFRVPNCGLPPVSRSSPSAIVDTSAMFENAPAKWRGHHRGISARGWSRFQRRQTCRRRGWSCHESRVDMRGWSSSRAERRIRRSPIEKVQQIIIIWNSRFF